MLDMLTVYLPKFYIFLLLYSKIDKKHFFSHAMESFIFSVFVIEPNNGKSALSPLFLPLFFFPCIIETKHSVTLLVKESICRKFLLENTIFQFSIY